MKSPPAQQQSPLTSTFEEASSQETPNLETLDQPVKGPVQTAPQIPDALKQQQEAAGALQGSQKVKLSREEAAADAGKIIKPAKKEKIEKKDKKEPDEAAVAARGDIASALNAGVQAVGLKTEKVQETPLKTDASIIKELAAQIVDRIDILRKGDETKTMITLQSPPVLKGATVTLTATESAKKEFNISFAGLSPDAKLLLDRKLKEDSLTQTLERKGIVVHTLTTSTQTETLLTAAPGQQTPRERQDQQQQQQQQQQRERERKGFQLEKEE